MVTLEDLPNELLSGCFSYLSGPNPNPDIQSLRLVSRRMHVASSPYLLTSWSLYLTTQSVIDLERLAAHAIFSRSLRTLRINVSYYDKLLAESFKTFVHHNSYDLAKPIEILKRSVGIRSPEELELIDQVSSVVQTWRAMKWYPDHHIDISRATSEQRLLLDAHTEYIRRYKKQTFVDVQSGLADILPAILEKLPALDEVIVEDSTRPPDPDDLQKLNHEALKAYALKTSRWGGVSFTCSETAPPIHLLYEVFESLASTAKKLKYFELSISAPFNLRYFNYFGERQLSKVQEAMAFTQEVRVYVDEWVRKGGWALHSDRPRDQWEHFCAFTRALFSSTLLSKLTLNFSEYSNLGGPPVSLSDFLPSPLPSSQLRHVMLREIAVRIEDFKDIIGDVERFDAKDMLLVGGRWVDLLDVLRGLKLQHVDLEGFDYWMDPIKNAPSASVLNDYVLGRSATNPLRDWKPR